MRMLILLIALLSTPIAQAEIFKCKLNGQTVFSQQPCAPDAVEVKPKVVPPSQGSAQAQSDIARINAEAADNMKRDRLLRENARAAEANSEMLMQTEAQRAAAINGERSACAGLSGFRYMACLDRANLHLQAEDMRTSQQIKQLEQQREILEKQRKDLTAPTP